MYRRSKYLQALLEIRREMAREADYDVLLFAESARTGRKPPARQPQTSAASSRDLAGAEPDIIPVLIRSNDS
jgi:1-acyl-sn-glycerol-3-phosphate acyltransferase